MIEDLWGFNDTRDLEKEIDNMPDSILKYQIELLSEKTDYILYGKPRFVKVESDSIDFKLATIFNVVVPCLDNYTKTLLILYSNAESEYPVSITVGTSYEDDCDWFAPDYTCNNIEEYIKAITEILKSENVMKNVKLLYSKAKVFER